MKTIDGDIIYKNNWITGAAGDFEITAIDEHNDIAYGREVIKRNNKTYYLKATIVKFTAEEVRQFYLDSTRCDMEYLKEGGKA